MKEGWWIRYGCQRVKIYPVDGHERWLRTRDRKNATKLGVPKNTRDLFPGLALNRERFLRFLLANAPIMRVRGHGSFVTFEYWSKDNEAAFKAIRAWGKRMGAGEALLLNIVNLCTHEIFRPLWITFDATMRKGKRIRPVERLACADVEPV